MSSRPRRVCINGRFLTQELTGVQRTARELTRALDTLVGSGEIDGAKWHFSVLAPGGTSPNFPLRHLQVTGVGHLRGHAWEQVEFPLYGRGAMLMSFANTGPIFAPRQIVTIHDASVFGVPTAYSRLFRLWYQLLLPRLGRGAAAVLTDSGFSCQELTRFARIPPSKLHIVPLGKEHVLGAAIDTGVLARIGIHDRPFILTVGSRSPHKNFRVILEAMEMLGEGSYDIVLAGGANARVFSGAPAHTTSRVREVGYVTDGELRALYEHATCFVFPSRYEGFGLPPLEAMACGCPVIVSSAASLPEVCGDAAVYFDPCDPGELARRIAEVMEDPMLQADLSRRGLEQADRFSWLESARAVIRVLDEVTVQ